MNCSGHIKDQITRILSGLYNLINWAIFSDTYTYNILVDNPARCCGISKISFYMNSHIDKLFGKRKRAGYFIMVGIVVQRDDGCGTTVKGNDSGGWSSDDVLL
jgi:hypothetical protein